MKKMLISLVIESEQEDLHEIKGKILATASECLVSCKVDELEEPKRELQLPQFMYH